MYKCLCRHTYTYVLYWDCTNAKTHIHSKTLPKSLKPPCQRLSCHVLYNKSNGVFMYVRRFIVVSALLLIYKHKLKVYMSL